VRIASQNFTPEIIAQIQALSDANPTYSRRKLSQQVCEKLDWRSPNGRLKEMSCRVALLKLHREGLLNLPAAGPAPPKRTRPRARKKAKPRRAGTPVRWPLSKLGELEIVVITNSDTKASRQWNEMMARYHYLGFGPLCGAQLRYLIKSERHGCIGGFAFSAAAWRLEARERWIGWDEEARRQNLNRVINNSRFLIVPHVQVKNLASRALSLVMNRLGDDWFERYGIAPVLVETFVERERFHGTSYRAANWIAVGQTKGRGRQDSTNEYAVAVKDIYVYPLRPDAQAILSQASSGEVVAPSRREPVDWADEEFGDAQLGVRRRVKRLMTITRDFYARPQANIPQACQTRAKTKAAYRFFDDENHAMEKLLAPHYESTRNRAAQEKVVLAVQDTTFLNYNAHPATEDLGPIASSADGAIGLVLHDTMAFNLERTPLGLLDIQCWARAPNDFGKKHRRNELPIEEKESQKWLVSYRAVAAAQKRCPETMFVSVGDREEEPLQWLLLTTLAVETFEQAIEKLNWYVARWGIEVYHRTLKSGCKIEERQLGTADRIEACLAIDLVVAWRIFHLTKLGREVPEVPCTVFFEEAAWKALVAYKTGNPVPPATPPTLRAATRMVASLGGFLGRKSDGEPGTQTLWLGLQRLDDLTAMWKITMAPRAP
jgi:hypothetical protein